MKTDIFCNMLIGNCLKKAKLKPMYSWNIKNKSVFFLRKLSTSPTPYINTRYLCLSVSTQKPLGMGTNIVQITVTFLHNVMKSHWF